MCACSSTSRGQSSSLMGRGCASVRRCSCSTRGPASTTASSAPVARIVRASAERPGGSPRSRRYYGDGRQVRFPLLSTYALTSEVIARADWNPEVLMRWMAGEGKEVDLRGELAAVKAPALVLAGDDAWAPLESAREVADLLGPTPPSRAPPLWFCAMRSTTSFRRHPVGGGPEARPGESFSTSMRAKRLRRRSPRRRPLPVRRPGAHRAGHYLRDELARALDDRDVGR